MELVLEVIAPAPGVQVDTVVEALICHDLIRCNILSPLVLGAEKEVEPALRLVQPHRDHGVRPVKRGREAKALHLDRLGVESIVQRVSRRFVARHFAEQLEYRPAVGVSDVGALPLVDKAYATVPLPDVLDEHRRRGVEQFDRLFHRDVVLARVRVDWRTRQAHLDRNRRRRRIRKAHRKLKRRLPAVALQRRHVIYRECRNLVLDDHAQPLSVGDGCPACVREVYVERLIPLDVRIAVDVDSENLRQRPAGIERQHLGDDGVVIAVDHSGRTVGRVDLHSHRRPRIIREGYGEIEAGLPGIALGDRNVIDRECGQIVVQDRTEALAVRDGRPSRVGQVHVERLITFHARITVDLNAQSLRQRSTGIKCQHLGDDGVVITAGHPGRTVGRIDLNHHC